MNGENLNDICRICGGSVGDLRESIEFHEKYISKYLPVKDNDRKLPRNMCLDCLTLIFSWNDLYERCEEFQSKLATQFSTKMVMESVDDDCIEPERVDCVEDETPIDSFSEEIRNDGLRIHPTKRTYKCHFCPHTTDSLEPHNDHVVSAHCELIFCCDICKKYLPRTSLISHMTEHALDTENNQPVTPPAKAIGLNCPKCAKQFTSKSGLTYHITSAHEECKKFQCTHCKNVFACKRVLLNHCRSVHSDNKLLNCNVCGKKFKTDSTLYAHRKTHLKLAPYKCDECGKAFKFKHHLNAHALQHRRPEVKSFECTYCRKRFSAQNNLTKHRKIHDKTMEFECHICGVKLMQKRYLRDHMKRVHQVMLECLGTSVKGVC